MHIWWISIGLALASVALAGLVMAEFFKVKKMLNTRLTLSLSLLGLVLLGEEITLTLSFAMWSKTYDPMYSYPALIISLLALFGLSILYYITRM